MRNPSSVSRMIASRALAVSPSGWHRAAGSLDFPRHARPGRKLMELATEALGMLDDHDRGAARRRDLDHRRGDQDRQSSIGEGRHGRSRSVPFRRPCSRPTLPGKRALRTGAFLDIGEIDFFRFLDQRQTQ